MAKCWGKRLSPSPAAILEVEVAILFVCLLVVQPGREETVAHDVQEVGALICHGLAAHHQQSDLNSKSPRT